MTLVFKIRQYIGSLDARIEQERKIAREESMQGSIAAEQRASAYLTAKEDFYKLFPEVLGEYRKP